MRLTKKLNYDGQSNQSPLHSQAKLTADTRNHQKFMTKGKGHTYKIALKSTKEHQIQERSEAQTYKHSYRKEYK